MSAPDLVILLITLTGLLMMLGLHLFVVRPRRGRALRALAERRGGVYARGRAVVPVAGGEAEIGAKHVSVPCSAAPDFFVFARSSHPSQPLSLGARELSTVCGLAGAVLPDFGERMGRTKVLELREGRLHLTGHEASRGQAEGALDLALEMAVALQRAPSLLWPDLHQDHRLLSDPGRLVGRVQDFDVEVALRPARVCITVLGSFGPLHVQRCFDDEEAGVELDNPVLGLALAVRSPSPEEARHRLSAEELTHPLLELVLDHDGRVSPDRILVDSADFGQAAVRQSLDRALRVACLLRVPADTAATAH